jgi:deazaflavin-dependent oxidoreductase (nitroreductase family)
MSERQVVDSPTGWVADHIKNYVDSDGEQGHLWKGVPTLLLTTQGRKSGIWRRSALIYGRDGERFVIVASQGGAPQHPAWFLNLSSNPEVEIQVGAEKFAAQARPATAAERARLWPVMNAIWPDYDVYQTRTDREIPLAIIERV